jgi:hypothetical protein
MLDRANERACLRGVVIKCTCTPGAPAEQHEWKVVGWFSRILIRKRYLESSRSVRLMIHEITHYGGTDDAELGLDWMNAHELDDFIDMTHKLQWR